MQEKITGVLFDIDNTLILFDEVEFYRAYLDRISKYFKDILDFHSFQERLLSSTAALLENDGRVSNANFFLSKFAADVPVQELCWKRFMEFYEKEFQDLRTLIHPVPGVLAVTETLKKKHIQIVIASNPIWPLLVQKQRLAWAGIQDSGSYFITHIENMSFCKPRLEYYSQICNLTGLNPKQCMMVGNDPYNDMVPKHLGMKTFLTQDSIKHDRSRLEMSRQIRNQTPNNTPTPDFNGNLIDVLEAIDKMIVSPESIQSKRLFTR